MLEINQQFEQYIVAVLGTSSKAVSSVNSYWDSDFSVLTLKTPTFCNYVLQFSPKLLFLVSTLLETLTLIKLLHFAVLLFFSCASGLQNKCTKDHASTAMSNTSPPSCHRASFPKGNFWSNKTWVWHLVGTFGHLAYTRVCWNAQLCLQCTDIHCTQPTQCTWACPGAVDLLCLGWTDYSWEWAEMTCPKSTALMVQVLTICVLCGSEIWHFPFIFDQWLCLIKRNFTPWHTSASQAEQWGQQQLNRH